MKIYFKKREISFKKIYKYIDNKELLFLLLISNFALFIACSTTNNCPKKTTDGNIASPVNTNNDEIAPYIFENDLYYTNRNIKTNDFQIMTYNLKNQQNKEPSKFINSPINKIEQVGLIKFYKNNQLNRTYAYFAGISGKSQKQNSDIFTSYKNKDGKWSEPENLKFLNSETYDSYPAISQDGNVIVFASTRDGGFGGIDLYKSVKNSDGTWSEPINLGSGINTEKDEISPFINFDNSLFYASNGFSENGDFDIFSANDDGNGNWIERHKLPSPVNTIYNEICPAIYGNEIFFSSDRPNNCGSYDIYRFQHCGDVVLEGTIEAKESDLDLSGNLYLMNMNRELIEIININNSGR